MTGFCGVLVLTNNVPSAEGQILFDRARAILSRNPEDVIQVYSSGRFHLAAFDNGAYERGREFIRPHNRRTVCWVSGDPLVVAKDGVSNDPTQSAHLVAKALLEKDHDTLAQTAGMFAAVAWDESSSTLRISTDKLALRPVYIYIDRRFAIFATNLRTLREVAPAPLVLSDQGIAEVMHMNQNFGGRTAYRDIRRLGLSEILSFQSTQEKSEHYFDWKAIPRQEGSESEICARIFAAFKRAISRRSRNKVADASLSGGMDSRSVVAGLLDSGCRVRTFNHSYPGSADEIIGRMVADAFGTEHTSCARDPARQMAGVPSYYVVRDNFPRHAGATSGGRQIWCGDGGSVGLGHVYMTPQSVELAANSNCSDYISKLFPKLKPLKTWVVKRKSAGELHRLAVRSLTNELRALASAPPDRRLYLFYLCNDQSRHLDLHFENIDLSRIELIAPFFDFDFLALIVAHPISAFLNHHLYNSWINLFHTAAGAIPWQAYPGHEPCPHPLPPGSLVQWKSDWFTGKRARQVAHDAASRILNTNDKRIRKYLSYSAVRLLKLLTRLGMERQMWQILLARRLFDAAFGPVAGGTKLSSGKLANKAFAHQPETSLQSAHTS